MMMRSAGQVCAVAAASPPARGSDNRLTDGEMRKLERSVQRLEASARRLRMALAEELLRRLSRDIEPANEKK
jgi:hypothetical protein